MKIIVNKNATQIFLYILIISYYEGEIKVFYFKLIDRKKITPHNNQFDLYGMCIIIVEFR